MCWNATSSLSFYIIGLIINTIILSISIQNKNFNLTALCAAWYFVLSMQLFEYFIWLKKNVKLTSSLAFIFNILQILMIYIVFMVVSSFYKVKWFYKFLASIIILIYIFFWVFWSLEFNSNSLQIIRRNHLIYPWWNTKLKSLIYIISLVLLFLLLARPIVWSVSTLAIIMFLYTLSFIFYRPYIASMWCCFAVIVPLLIFLLPQKKKL